MADKEEGTVARFSATHSPQEDARSEAREFKHLRARIGGLLHGHTDEQSLDCFPIPTPGF